MKLIALSIVVAAFLLGGAGVAVALILTNDSGSPSRTTMIVSTNDGGSPYEYGRPWRNNP